MATVRIVRQPARMLAIASAPASSADPSARRSRTTTGSTSMPDSSAPIAAPASERREVADRVAPALVHLDGLDHELRRGGPPGRRSGAAGDHADTRAAGRGRVHRPDRRGGAALVRDADHEPAGRRIEGELERLRRRHGRRADRQAGRRGSRPGGSRPRPGPRARSSRSRSRRSARRWSRPGRSRPPAGRPGRTDRPAGRGGARPRTAPPRSSRSGGTAVRIGPTGQAARPTGRARGRGARADRSSSSAEDTAATRAQGADPANGRP